MEISRKNFSEKDLLIDDLKSLEGYIDDLWLFLPIPVCFVNSAFCILNASKALEDISGKKEIEIIGENLKDILKDSQKLLKEAQEKEIIFTKETVLFRKEGKGIPVSISAKARKDEEGDLLGYFFAFIDLTLIKDRENELNKKIQELEKFQKLTVGRELKMVKLKKELKVFKKG